MAIAELCGICSARVWHQGRQVITEAAQEKSCRHWFCVGCLAELLLGHRGAKIKCPVHGCTQPAMQGYQRHSVGKVGGDGAVRQSAVCYVIHTVATSGDWVAEWMDRSEKTRYPQPQPSTSKPSTPNPLLAWYHGR
jgi:hypothetical protein